MAPQSQFAWDALEFRTPVMLRIVGGLSEEAIRWWPPNGSNSVAWLIWHIAEVDEVRALSKQRLTETGDEGFDRVVQDEHFGSLSVRQVWAGVATSCAWHSGQIALTARLVSTPPAAARLL